MSKKLETLRKHAKAFNEAGGKVDSLKRPAFIGDAIWQLAIGTWLQDKDINGQQFHALAGYFQSRYFQVWIGKWLGVIDVESMPAKDCTCHEQADYFEKFLVFVSQKVELGGTDFTVHMLQVLFEQLPWGALMKFANDDKGNNIPGAWVVNKHGSEYHAYKRVKGACFGSMPAVITTSKDFAQRNYSFIHYVLDGNLAAWG